MPDLQESTRALRLVTQLSKRQLANRAGISESLLGKIESGEKKKIKAASAIAILKGALTVGNIPEQVISDFCDASRVTQYERIAAIGSAFAKSPDGVNTKAIVDLAGKLSPDEGTALLWLFDLIDASSPVRVLSALASIASMSGIKLSDPLPGSSMRPSTAFARTLDVRTPPVRRPDGAVEQVITTYEVQDAPPVSDSRTRRDRRHA